jgi:hypothetical protein
VRTVTNPPSRSSTPRRRSGRFSSSLVDTATFPVEDITRTDTPATPFEFHAGVSGIPTTAEATSQPPLRQPTVRRGSRMRKNENWTNEQLSSAIAAHDNGMSMKKASEQFNISYSSFREHCYGVRKSRIKGVPRILTIGEE